MTRTAVRNLLFSTAAAMLSGCAIFAPKPPPPPPPPPGPRPPYVWDAEKAKTEKGPAAIVIKLGEQRVYFYKGDTLIGDTKCSSGKRNFETPAGEYKVTQKNAKHVSNLYGNFVDAEGNVTKRDVDMSKMKVPEGETFAGAKMPYYMRFHGGYGLHSGIVPSRPASHGCVRLPRVMAERLFFHTPMGTPVSVLAPEPKPEAVAAADVKKKGG